MFCANADWACNTPQMQCIQYRINEHYYTNIILLKYYYLYPTEFTAFIHLIKPGLIR